MATMLASPKSWQRKCHIDKIVVTRCTCQNLSETISGAANDENFVKWWYFQNVFGIQIFPFQEMYSYRVQNIDHFVGFTVSMKLMIKLDGTSNKRVWINILSCPIVVCKWCVTKIITVMKDYVADFRGLVKRKTLYSAQRFMIRQLHWQK